MKFIKLDDNNVILHSDENSLGIETEDYIKVDNLNSIDFNFLNSEEYKKLPFMKYENGEFIKDLLLEEKNKNTLNQKELNDLIALDLEKEMNERIKRVTKTING